MGGMTASFRNKRDAIHDLQLALLTRRTFTGSDDVDINPTLVALENEAQDLDAAIAADKTPVLQGPSRQDAAALQDAIRRAEDAIAQNASVNRLVITATTLISTLK